MRCPQCSAEAPLWAPQCPHCAAVLFTVPALEPPPELAAPREVVVLPAPVPPEPAPRLVGVHDFRPHITVGAVLAFVSTLVLPPLFGGIAVALGWLAYSRGSGPQRRQGLWVMLAGAVGTGLGLALGWWVDQAGLLT